MNKEKYYLGIAEAVSKKSTCLKKHYGAIIVKNDIIVSTGYNGACRGESHCTVCTKVGQGKDIEEYKTCPACHAEQNSIIHASFENMNGATLYLYGFDVETQQEINAWPCEICLRLIKNSGIAAVYNKQGIIYQRADLDNILYQVRDK